MSLFKKTEVHATRLRALVYGATGTGKTITAISFPDPAIFDIEDGARHYAKYGKELHRVVGTNLKLVQGALAELLQDPQNYKTAVLDSFTKLYSAIVSSVEEKMKMRTGNPNYEIQPLDYKAVKSLTKNILDKFLALDMNLIVTAWSKTKWAKGEFMKEEGTIPDVPDYVPFEFDVVLELFKREDYYGETKSDTDLSKKFIAVVKKDRTNTLPPVFDYTYEKFTEYMGIEGLEREPILLNQQLNQHKDEIRTETIKFNGEDIKTAGITAKQLKKIEKAVEEGDAVMIQKQLKDLYFAESFLDLKEDEADAFIETIKNIENAK